MSFFVENKINGKREAISYARWLEGREVFLCGSGPSIKTADKDFIESSNKVIMCLNASFQFIQPDIWMGMDAPEVFNSRIWEYIEKKERDRRLPGLFPNTMDCVRICNWFHRDKIVKGFPLKKHGNVRFICAAESRDDNPQFVGDFINFLFEGNTFSTALHVLHWLKPRRVNLVGCDFGGRRSGPMVPSPNRKINFKNSIESLRLAARKSSVEYISCTQGSPINEFLEYKNIEDS